MTVSTPTTIDLSNTLCIECGSTRLRATATAIQCGWCGTTYEVIDGVPFLVRYESADALSLIEILRSVGHQANPTTPESLVQWHELLEKYHNAPDRDEVLAAAGSLAQWLPHRHRQYAQMKLVLDGEDLHGRTVLDIGAGAGFDSSILQRMGAEVTAIEFSPIVTSEGVRAAPACRWFGASALRLPFVDESFDVVAAQATLHHVRDVPRTLEEMARVLKPGGLLITISDSYRRSSRPESYELKHFDADPAVLRGTNESIPSFADLTDFFAADPETFELRLFTLRAFNVPKPDGNGRETFDQLREWDMPGDLPRLAESDGGMSLRVRKRRSRRSPVGLAKGNLLKPSTLLETFEGRHEAVATVTHAISRDLVNQPFPGPEGNTKFNLLNGWRWRAADEPYRRAYLRGRWFLSPGGDIRSLDFEFLIEPSPNHLASRRLRIYVDGETRFDGDAAAGVWQTASIDITARAPNVTFALEFAVEADGAAVEDNTICVRRIAMSRRRLPARLLVDGEVAGARPVPKPFRGGIDACRAMANLRREYAFPSVRPDREPFYWCLDSWGKELVKEVIRERGIRLMVEVGVFFGGSIQQWLETSPDLTVIGIDPWKTNWAPYFERTVEMYERHIDYGNLDRHSMLRQLDGEEATYECMLSNLWEHRDRFVPMRGTSPDKLYELRDLGVVPDLVYIDSDKHGDDLAVCHEEFPGCVICGDDWTWNPKDGYPIRKAVLPFAEKHGFEVKVLKGTWLLVPRD